MDKESDPILIVSETLATRIIAKSECIHVPQITGCKLKKGVTDLVLERFSIEAQQLEVQRINSQHSEGMRRTFPTTEVNRQRFHAHISNMMVLLPLMRIFLQFFLITTTQSIDQ